MDQRSYYRAEEEGSRGEYTDKNIDYKIYNNTTESIINVNSSHRIIIRESIKL